MSAFLAFIYREYCRARLAEIQRQGFGGSYADETAAN